MSYESIRSDELTSVLEELACEFKDSGYTREGVLRFARRIRSQDIDRSLERATGAMAAIVLNVGGPPSEGGSRVVLIVPPPDELGTQGLRLVRNSYESNPDLDELVSLMSGVLDDLRQAKHVEKGNPEFMTRKLTKATPASAWKPGPDLVDTGLHLNVRHPVMVGAFLVIAVLVVVALVYHGEPWMPQWVEQTIESLSEELG